MGENPINRVLDFLIENDRDSWSMVEISKGAKVGYSTLKLVLPKMENNSLVKITKIISKAKLYRINDESSIVKEIYSLRKKIILEKLEKLI